jgi:LmbE family N-acetylglucosaminyl deacetylase
MGRSLAGIFAHPDDDTYALGGTVALLGPEVDYTLVVATSGEAGQIADPSLATRESLGPVREAEEREALARLGAGRVDVRFLRYPDGGLADAPHDELVGRVVEVLVEARPLVVVTFGPEGVTRHPDHTAVSQVATEAFHRARAQGGDGAFRRLLYAAIPQSLVDRFTHRLRGAGIDLGGPGEQLLPRGVPDHTVAVRVDCRRVLAAKLEALRAHRTQAEELETIPQDFLPELLGQEFFVQAWPPVTDPSGPFLSGVFEGLEG